MQSNTHFTQAYFVKELFKACMLFLFFFEFVARTGKGGGGSWEKSIIKLQRAYMSQMRNKVSDLI